jgi:hypothetical protein
VLQCGVKIMVKKPVDAFELIEEVTKTPT